MRTTRTYAGLLLTWLVAMSAVGVLTLNAPVSASTSNFFEVDQFTTTDDGSIYIDAAARLLYDVRPASTSSVASAKTVLRDADSLNVLAEVDFPAKVFRSNNRRQPIAAVDEANHLLFVASDPTTSSPSPSVAVIDGVNRRFLGHMQAASSQPVLDPRFGVFGISYDATRGKVYLLLAFNGIFGSLPATNVHLVQLDLNAFLQGQPALDWTFPMPFCHSLPSSLGNMPGIPAALNRPYVYVACTETSSPGATGPRPNQGVYRVPLTNGRPPVDAATVELFRIPGDFQFGGVLFDPGSERLLLATRTFGPQGEYVFDGQSGAVVGLVDHQNNVYGACINSRTGRYYIAGDGAGSALNIGFSVGDIRPTPPDNGRSFPELGRAPAPKPGPLGCDPVSRRVFVPYTAPSDTIIRVFQDELPAHAPAGEINPDLYTQDIPDDVATTTVKYNGISRGYGARLAEVGGPSGLTQDFVNAKYFDTSSMGPTLGASRILTLAPVGIGSHSVSLSDSSGAGAVAAGATRDALSADTSQRLVGPTRDRVPSNVSQPVLPGVVGSALPEEIDSAPGHGKNSLPGDVWPYYAVACNRSPGQPRVTDADETHGVSTECDTPNGTSRAEARAENVTGPVAIEGAWSAATVRTDPMHGLVAEATAAVGRITVESIGLVLEDLTASATSVARGRPGTARGTYMRSLGRASLGGVELCEGNCDIEAVVDAINNFPTENVRASLPAMDAGLANGTPKGAAAAIVRDRYEQLNDEVLNRLSPDDQQVPALRLMIGEDAYQHAFFVIDFAAPEVATLRSLSPCAFCDRESDVAPVLPVDSAFSGASGGTDQVLQSFISPTPILPNPPPPNRPKGIVRVLRPVQEGLQQLAAGLSAVLTDPGKLPMVVAVWSVMAIPIYLASRRKLLIATELGETQ